MEKKEKEIQGNILKIYKEPMLIGLNNIGAISYINSILQCLSQTPALINYFLNDSNKGVIMNNNINKENKNLPQLSPVFLKLIKILWDKNKKGSSFSPYDFMETVEKINRFFKMRKEGHPKDFLVFILEQIHKELKRSANSKNQPVIQPFNLYDKNNSFSYFMNAFQKERSIISDEFFGILETTIVCFNCKRIYSSQGMNYPESYNYGNFICLVFLLEKVKNFRNEYCVNSNIQIIQTNSVTLNDCFSYYQETEILTGENKCYCLNCKQLYDTEFTCRIYSTPNILILILSRGKYNEYNIKLDFNETLDLTQFVEVKDHPQIIYNLYGVITHVEQSGSKTQFIAFCKSPINNKWYKYNNAIVNPVEDVQKEIINFGTPYMLFYQKSKKI